MLSSKFIDVVTKLLTINNDNQNEVKLIQGSDNKRIILYDQCSDCNFLYMLLSHLCLNNSSLKDKFSDHASCQLRNLYNYYNSLINGGTITDYQKNATIQLDYLQENDKKIIVKYLDVFENDFVLTNFDDKILTKLYLDYIFAPIFFKKIKEGNNYDFFSKIDELRKENRTRNNMRYSEYTMNIENSENISQIIQFIKNINKPVEPIKPTESVEPVEPIKPEEQLIDCKNKQETIKKTKKPKVKIPATLRNSVWNVYIGKNKEGLCFCCNTEPITTGNFECGHIVAEVNNGELTLQNLRPICSLCNKSMSTKNMEIFMNKHGFTKNENWNGVETKTSSDDSQIKIKKSKDNELSTYLESLNMKQLQQICMLFEIYHGGTKPKLIMKIQKNKLSKNDIECKIDKDKQYFIKCEENDYCSNCKFNNNIIIPCDVCIKKESNVHVYYTKHKLSTEIHIINNHRKIRDGKTRCNKCGKITYMEEYDNAFI